MIKFEVKLAAQYAACATDEAFLQVNSLHIGFDNFHMTKNASEGINDVGRIKIAGCDLMQHRREQNEILPTNQRHFHVWSSRQTFVKMGCRIQPGESAASNDDLRLVHFSNEHQQLNDCT